VGGGGVNVQRHVSHVSAAATSSTSWGHVFFFLFQFIIISQGVQKNIKKKAAFSLNKKEMNGSFVLLAAVVVAVCFLIACAVLACTQAVASVYATGIAAQHGGDGATLAGAFIPWATSKPIVDEAVCWARTVLNEAVIVGGIVIVFSAVALGYGFWRESFRRQPRNSN
jgi:hypothetical protein